MSLIDSDSSNRPTPPEDPGETFEASLERLERLTLALENPETGLDEAIGLYEQGAELAKACMVRLQEAEQRIEVIGRSLDSDKTTNTLFGD